MSQVYVILHEKQNFKAIDDLLIDYHQGELSKENAKIVAQFLESDPELKFIYNDLSIFFDDDAAFKAELLYPESVEKNIKKAEALSNEINSTSAC